MPRPHRIPLLPNPQQDPLATLPSATSSYPLRAVTYLGQCLERSDEFRVFYLDVWQLSLPILPVHHNLAVPGHTLLLPPLLLGQTNRQKNRQTDKQTDKQTKK